MTGRNTGANDGAGGTTRRQVLTSLGAAGALGLAGCSGGGDGGDGGEGDDGSGSTDGDDDEVTLGLAIPQTGNALNEGERLLAGYRLAVDHINESAGLAEGSLIQDSLGDGILGQTASTTVADTASTADGATEAGQSLVQDEGADALLGAGSSAGAISLMGVASAESTVYMSGFAASPALGGTDCSRYGFSEMLNTRMIATALAPAAREEFGSEKLFAQVYPNTDFGKSMFGDVQEGFQNVAEWRQIGSEPARVGTTEFRDPIEAVLELGPDVLVLGFTGLDGGDALREARSIVPDDVGIITPLFNRPMARNAGDALDGILGTTHWSAAVDSEVSNAFASAWAEADTGSAAPSDLAHLAYVQTMQYAAAAERAGSVAADDVVAELEGHSYDFGLGEETMRECDHQAVRPVPVVRGLPSGSGSDGQYFETVAVVADAGYACEDRPASRCSF
jgi:ABC-type branched-subunit amino acid transport system substrate-binding protein